MKKLPMMLLAVAMCAMLVIATAGISCAGIGPPTADQNNVTLSIPISTPAMSPATSACYNGPVYAVYYGVNVFFGLERNLIVANSWNEDVGIIPEGYFASARVAGTSTQTWDKYILETTNPNLCARSIRGYDYTRRL